MDILNCITIIITIPFLYFSSVKPFQFLIMEMEIHIIAVILDIMKRPCQESGDSITPCPAEWICVFTVWKCPLISSPKTETSVHLEKGIVFMVGKSPPCCWISISSCIVVSFPMMDNVLCASAGLIQTSPVYVSVQRFPTLKYCLCNYCGRNAWYLPLFSFWTMSCFLKLF